MYEVLVNNKKYVILTQNWEDLRVYLKVDYRIGFEKKTEELGYLDINDELEDELYLRFVPDEIGEFVLDNRKMIIEEADVDWG